jgi:hypothetical protein
MTAKAACERLAAAGGVTEFASGGFGISPAARRHVENTETLRREHKRARQLVRENPGVEEFWERALTEFMSDLVPPRAPKAPSTSSKRSSATRAAMVSSLAAQGKLPSTTRDAKKGKVGKKYGGKTG